MVGEFDSRVVFTALTALMACERLFELALSRRNARRTLARGGVEHRPSAHLTVVFLQMLWLVAAPLEVWILARPWHPVLATVCGTLAAAAMTLRYWSVTTLAERWNTRIITIPGRAPVTTGPYRFLRHPNYLAFFVELFAFPLIHTAWCTASVLGTANLVAAHFKAKVEERALDQDASYTHAFAGRRRYLPGAR